MKANWFRPWVTGVLLVLGIAESNSVHGQTNLWSNAQSGTWDWATAANWTLGVPNSTQSCFITNTASAPVNGARTRTVTVGSILQTAGNLTMSGAGGGMNTTHNTLFVNGGGLDIADGCALKAGSTLSITNGILSVDGGTLSVDGGVLLNTGTLETLYEACGLFGCGYVETYTVIGNTGFGTFTMKNGNWLSGPVQVGSSISTYGTLTISGGSTTLQGIFDPYVLDVLNGSVWFVGGVLDTSSGESYIGDAGGTGQMTVSNGTWTAGDSDAVIGYQGGSGTLSIVGGSNSFANLVFCYGANSHGTLWMNNGVLNAAQIDLGYESPATSCQMTLSNGTVNTKYAFIGTDSGSVGTLIIAGGEFNVYTEMGMALDCTGTGVVDVTGGSLFVTNGAHNAVLDLESGTLTLSGGTLVVDVLERTNSCASFTQTGGTLVVGGVTNPSPSQFTITAINREGNDMRISWQTPGGVTNILQATNGAPDGSYNTNFVDLPPQTIVTGFGLITTNYLDVGGATNFPSRFYRVRLVP